MKQLLINILESFGYPVFLQGTLNGDEQYPESFITFWVDYTANNSDYDNDIASWQWSFAVIFYSSNAELVNTKPDEIRAALKAAGFIPQGKGQDIPSDEPTHTGWATDYLYIENN